MPESDASWQAYCAAYNVNEPTEEQKTTFLTVGAVLWKKKRL